MAKRSGTGGGQIIRDSPKEASRGSEKCEEVARVGFLIGRHVLTHPIGTQRDVHIAAIVVVQLEFLAELALVEIHQHVA